MKKYNFLWLLLLFCAGCVDHNAHAVVKYMKSFPRGSSRTVTFDEVVSLYPDTQRKLGMEYLFCRATALQIKADMYGKFFAEKSLSPAEKNKVLKIIADLLAEQAVCNAELSAAALWAADSELRLDTSRWSETRTVDFTENELFSVLLLKSADRAVYPPSARVRSLELELRKRYIALRQAEEIVKIAGDELKLSAQKETLASCAAKAALTDAELRVKLAVVSILELLDEKDFSAVPDYLKRLEKERVRFEKAARVRKNR